MCKFFIISPARVIRLLVRCLKTASVSFLNESLHQAFYAGLDWS